MVNNVTQVPKIEDGLKEASNVRSTTKCTAVLILGLHRSGTSATTRVISLLGADLPSKLMEASTDNICGFWESLSVH